MTADEAPHEIVLARDVKWKEAQNHAVWLAQQSDTEGHFINGKRRLLDREIIWYRFTCPNTAFLFRLRFG